MVFVRYQWLILGIELIKRVYSTSFVLRVESRIIYKFLFIKFFITKRIERNDKKIEYFIYIPEEIANSIIAMLAQ